MPVSLDALLVFLVFMTASLVHASFGFGTALVAMPLLSLFVPLAVATPLVGFATLTTITLIIAREWRQMDIRSAWQLLAASVPGIPVGLYVLCCIPGTTLRHGLGVVLLAYSVFAVAGPQYSPRLPAWLVWPCGFVAGVLGAALNVNGPPVVIYGIVARWSGVRFRATLQGFFLPSAAMICIAHGVAGLWTPVVMTFYAAALPAIVLGVLVGRFTLTRLSPERFERGLYLLLAVLGGLMFMPVSAP